MTVFFLLVVIAGVAGFFFLDWHEIPGQFRKLLSLPEKGLETKSNARGTIYDRNFKEMAVSLDRVSVYVRPRDLQDITESGSRLAAVLGLNEQELFERLGADSQQVWLAKNISLEEEKAVTDLQLAGVFLHREKVRYYPYKSIAAHVVGYADHNMGLAGAEHYYNRLLEQVSIRQEDFPHIDLEGHSKTGISGQHLVLTIDLKIQDFLEKYVAALGAVHEGSEIVTLLMETETGAIVANANFPSYDPNLFYQYKKESLANLLFAPVVIPKEIRNFYHNAARLQAGFEKYEQSYPWSIAAGAVDVGSELRLWERMGITRAPQPDFTVQGVDDGGVTEKAADPGKGESGTLPAVATPIQILLGVNFLVNGGHHVQPHVLDRILERNGGHEYSFRLATPSRMREQILYPALAESRAMLRAQGKNGVLDSIIVTTQDHLQQPLSSGGEVRRNKMMVVVLPADKPELILLVLVRQPYLEPSHTAGKEGFDLAGPVAKILPSMVALQQVYKNLADMMRMSESKEGNYQQEQEKKVLVGLDNVLEQHHPVMPDLMGTSLRRALRVVQDTGVRVRAQGSGRVVAQSPAPGASLEGVRECVLTLKKDEKPGQKISVPGQGVSVDKNKQKVQRQKEQTP